MFKKLLVLMLFLSLLTLIGCTSAQSMKGQPPGGDVTPQTPATDSGLSTEDGSTQVPDGSLATPGATTNVTLYFASPDGQNLVPVTREIPKVEGIARATLQELVLGPGAGSDLLPAVPAGTALRDINIRPNGLAVVDFSRELMSNHKGGTTGEMLTVYSIVNTLTQFPTVKKVQFLVEGQYQETLAGHLDIREPLTRNESLVMSK